MGSALLFNLQSAPTYYFIYTFIYEIFSLDLNLKKILLN